MTPPDLSPVSVNASRASVVRLMIPSDANFTGHVFGGAILAEVDRVAFITATRHAKALCVTASFDRVDFIEPVQVGEVVNFDARLTSVGRTSMEVWVRVSAEHVVGGGAHLVGEAYVTMVAVDETGRPTPIPPLALETDEDRRRFEEGRQRMELRRATRAARAG